MVTILYFPPDTFPIDRDRLCNSKVDCTMPNKEKNVQECDARKA